MSEANNNIKICSLEKIKNDYFLIKIFDNLKETKKLNIIRYNKRIQNRMNKDINDYIKEYSKIEIEIIPAENNYGKFINIPYYHIYFNDNKEEQKKTKINEDDNIKKITIIIINYKNKTLSELFYCCRCIKKINFIKFNRTDIKDMKKMFCGCSLLKELNIFNFKTNDVTDMSQMFHGCSLLKEINLSSFNTNNVKDMSHMFSECSSLKELNLSNFNTHNVNDMNCMFYGCSSLKELKTNFSINKKTETRYMFIGCPDEVEKKFNENNKKLKLINVSILLSFLMLIIALIYYFKLNN